MSIPLYRGRPDRGGELITESQERVLERDVAEIKALLAEICKVLGIGATPPATVFDLKERARRIVELKTRRGKP
jgi:hypothetical protein